MDPPPTDAEQRVIAAVRAIPEGFVRAYGDLSPGAPRFAGHVLKRARDRDLPWWRVVRADGSLPIGEEQRFRLEAEGVPFLPGSRARIDMRVARMVDGSVPPSPWSVGRGAKTRSRAP